VGENGPRAASRDAQTPAPDDRPRHEPDSATSPAEIGTISLGQNALTVLFGGMAIAGYVAIRALRRRPPSAVEELDEPREFLERLDEKRFIKRQDILRVLAADPQALLENRLEVRHVMTSRLRNVRPKTPLAEIKEIMAEEIVRHFPVVNDKGTIVGIVSDRDLFVPEAHCASDVMTRTVVTVSPKARLETAAAQLVNRNISCLPVMDKGVLVGIVTTTDLVMTLQCAFQLHRRQTRPSENGGGAIESASYNDALTMAAMCDRG
jgi:acetoin utilization protein AcuB